MGEVPKSEMQLILELLKEVRNDQKETTRAISEINTQLVGREACSTFRKEIYERIEKVEAVCTTFEATRAGFVDSSKLAEAKYEVIGKASENDCRLEERLAKLETRAKLFDLTWETVRDNRVLLSAAFILVAQLIGIYSSRWGEFGLEKTLAIVGVVVLVVVVLWLALNRKRLSSFWPFVLLVSH